MKLTNKQLSRIAVFGFLGLIVAFIIGAVTIVLMPFALIYAIVYLVVLIYLFVLYLKNKPEEAKESLKLFVDYCSDPQVVHDASVRRNKKRSAKRHKAQMKRTKRRTRNLAIAYSANRAIREFLK